MLIFINTFYSNGKILPKVKQKEVQKLMLPITICSLVKMKNYIILAFTKCFS